MALIRIILILITFNSFSQIIRSSDLPKMVKDSIYVNSESWLQTPQQEAKQQASIFGLERKIKRLSNIIHERKSIEPIIDSLITELEKTTNTKDSLVAVLEFQSLTLVSSCQSSLNRATERINNLKGRIISLTYQKRRQGKRMRIIGGLLIIETALLIIVL